MIQPLFDGMLAILLTKFMLNDVPHAAGITGKADNPHSIPLVKYSLSQEPDEDLPLARKIKIEARVAGKLAGMVAGRIYTPTGTGTIAAIVVSEEFRRKGIGTRLLGKILEEYKREGIKRVTATWPSEEGEMLLLKYGFREEGEALVFDIL